MMHHPKMKEWDDRMKSLFDEIDGILEDRYGDRYPLHPNRPHRDSTRNPAMDGLFNVGASFSTGYGTELGRGYVVDIYMSTLAKVPAEIRAEIELLVMSLIREKLPGYFPDRELNVEKDGNLIKIYGDLSLGSL